LPHFVAKKSAVLITLTVQRISKGRRGGLASKTKTAGPKREELIDRRLTKAIAHPLRVAILVECDRAPISPVEYIRRHGGELSNVAYHFRILEKYDCLEIVREQPKRGANEHIYGVTRRALLTDEDFHQMPANIRAGFNGSIIATFADRAQESVEAGTIEPPDRNQHLTWTPLRLDKTTFDNVMEKLGEVYELLGVEQLAAKGRLDDSGDEPTYATVGLFGFPSPPPDRDHDLPDTRPLAETGE
jgi:hypothetical protein